MNAEIEIIAREIERLRRQHAYLLAEFETSREAPCRWEVVERTLCWHVFVDGILEPDLDVEILGEVVIVRGGLDTDERPICQALLPVPAPYRAQRPHLRFVAGVLEVRIEARA